MALDIIPRKQTSPPVEPDYANQAAMIAAQSDQVAGWFYHDGTSYWQYKGTTAGTIADYREVVVIPYPEMDVREDNQLLFDNDYATGIEAAARSGNITVSFTGSKRGACTVMRHNDGSAFTYPTENLIISGEYVPSVDNYLFFLLVNKTVSSEVILCTISQEIP